MTRAARSADFQSAVSPISNRRAGDPLPGRALLQTIQATGITFRALVLVVTLGLLLRPNTLLACAACYGQSDGPMARGMNWGILSLLGIVVTVLGGVATFFVYLARRSAALSATANPGPTGASDKGRIPSGLDPSAIDPQPSPIPTH
jgi:hypothetical protein